MKKTNFKKLLSLALACVMLVVVSVSGVGSVAFASENSYEELSMFVLSREEMFANDSLRARGIDEESESEILYDYNNEPTYLLTYSENGYVIIDRLTNLVLESGESNPYRNYEASKKYFGGMALYFIEDNVGIYDLIREQYVNEIATRDYVVDQRAQNQGVVTRSSNVQSSTITYTKIIPNAYEYIQRKAFGNNGDDYVNTCTAIATAIVLNYLDLQYNDSIVPTIYESETLFSPIHHTGNNPKIPNYPKADSFHKFLVDDCSLGVAHFAYAIPNAVEVFKNSFATVGSTGLYAEWVINFGSQFGIDELENNKPTMLTSTLAFGEVAVSLHTTPVYGYREYSDGKKEWLIHMGWYPELNEHGKENADIIASNVYMPQIWVPESTASFLYRFNYNA